MITSNWVYFKVVKGNGSVIGSKLDFSKAKKLSKKHYGSKIIPVVYDWEGVDELKKESYISLITDYCSSDAGGWWELKDPSYIKNQTREK